MLADLKYAILVKSVLTQCSYWVLGLVSRILLGTAPRFNPQITLRLDDIVAHLRHANTMIPAKHQLVWPADLSIEHILVCPITVVNLGYKTIIKGYNYNWMIISSLII